MFLSHIDRSDRTGGVLGLVRHKDSSKTELFCVHNSFTMCMAYMSNKQKSAKALFSKSERTDFSPKVNAFCI